MTLTKEKAKENLAKLIEKFQKELSSGRAQEYNEEATKISFIQPLLEHVLGWEVTNHDEVTPEEKISRGRVDYGLKVEGKIKVFVEAKPIKADLNKHIEQAIGYGYNSKRDVSFVLLTDFEGIKLFDVTVKPDLRNPKKGEKIDLKWDQYISEFEELWKLSKESVIAGKLDELLLVKPKERNPVDKAILADLRKWQESLAKDIFKNNEKMFYKGDKGKEANYLREITQEILDRIIFMRSCEDRKLIHRPTLKEIFEERSGAVGSKTMLFLKEEFKHYNIVFDSDLFYPQEWENDLVVDFNVMNQIIMETNNPYKFDVIPVEVLGSIYEQYLGYTITLSDHGVKYELKSAVRKAGGVYYTPEYIVDYIVKNTVGRILKEATPQKVKILRILDPACGSGSFLIRAYDELLNYYRDKKIRIPKFREGQMELDLEHKDTILKLTIHEKAEILRKHIFGVDIDEQAVEVTKLSLMLKMLDDEHGIIPGRAVLPMLDKNIRCGNSLVSGDTLELKKYFSDDLSKVNALDWNEKFREIIVGRGGFDIVVGNPPYVRPHKLNKNIKNYLWDHYRPIFEAKSDLYACFIKKSIDLLKQGGLMSFIVSKTWLSLESFAALRRYILSKTKVLLIALPPKKVFEKATVETVIMALQREENKKERLKNKISLASINQERFIKNNEIAQSVFENTHLNTFDLSINDFTLKFNERMKKNSLPLNKCVRFFYGIKTGDDSKFISTKKLSPEYKKILRRSDFSRYQTHWGGEYVWYAPDKMKAHRKTARPGTPERFESSKIMVLDIAKKIVANIDEEKYYVKDALLFLRKDQFDLKYTLGILNSFLMSYYYAKTFTTLSVAKNAILTLPICTVDFSNPSERKLHDNLISLVNVLLLLNKKVKVVKGSEKEQIQRQIEKADREIDDLVYKLYSITEEERKLIEATK